MNDLVSKLHGHDHGSILKKSLVLYHLNHLLRLVIHGWLDTVLAYPVHAGLHLVAYKLLFLLLLDLLVRKIDFFANLKLFDLVHDSFIL